MKKLYTRRVERNKKIKKSDSNLAIIYVRVSDSEQIDGTSLDAQVRLCREYLEKQGLVLACEPFIEKGESAKTTSRTMLIKALEHCRVHKNKIAAFVVWKVDRFARNTEDHFAVKRVLIGYGTTLHSVTEPISDDPMGKLMETMLAGFAEFDNDIRSLRCRNGMMDRIRQGIYPFKPPVGYICERNKMNGKKKTTPDKIHPVLFPMIRAALIGYMNNRFSNKDMVRFLKENGYEEVSGLKATPQNVDGLLYKYIDFYAGKLYCADDEKYYPGLHEKMINEEELEAILAVRDGKKGHGVKKNVDNPEYPLRRLVLCAECSYPFTASSPRGRSGKGYPSYSCFNKGCRMCGKTIKKGVLESAFMDLLKRVTPTPEFTAYIHHVVIAKKDELISVRKKEQQMQKDQVVMVKAKREKIYQLAETGLYTQAMLKERLEANELELLTTNITLHEDTIDLLEAEFEKEYFELAIRDISRIWLDLTPSFRRGFQTIIFPEGLKFERGSGFWNPVLSCIFSLECDSETENHDLVDPSGFEPLASSMPWKRSTK